MTTLIAYLKRARERNLDQTPLVSHWINIYFSGNCYALWRRAVPLVSKYSSGLVLDAGSGRGGWSEVITETGAQREALDVRQRGDENLTWAADLMRMPEVPSNRFDCVVCHQVLEHLPRPWQAVGEIHRVLKPGGTLVLSVPHLSRLHEMPHDYFRYTPNGLASLLEDQGFEILTSETYGGVLSFLHHQVATVVLGLAGIFRPLFLLCTAVNAPVSVAMVLLDGFTGSAGLMPCGVVAVARRPGLTS